MSLSRQQILEMAALETETVDGVIVSEIGAEDSMRLWLAPELKAPDGGVDMVKFTVALVTCAIVDDAGNRIFNDEDRPRVGRFKPAKFNRLSAVAKKLNGLTGEEVKNSEETDSGDLLSVSASTSDTDTQTSCSEA